MKDLKKCLLLSIILFTLCGNSAFAQWGGPIQRGYGPTKEQMEAKKQREREEEKRRQEEEKRRQEEEEARRLKMREDKYDRTLTITIPVLVALAILGIVIASIKKKGTSIAITQTNEQKEDIQSKLRHLNNLYAEGLITENEFKKKKAELLDKL